MRSRQSLEQVLVKWYICIIQVKTNCVIATPVSEASDVWFMNEVKFY